MKWLRILPMVAALWGLAGPAMADESSTDARHFIENYIRGSLSIRTDATLAPDQRRERARALLHDSYDFAGTPRAILGRYWDHATPDQQSRTLVAVEDYVITNYGPRFDRVANRLKVSGVSVEERHTIVHTVDSDQPDEAIAIDWVLTQPDPGHWRITDVVVNGFASMEIIRQEFTAVLRANNGDIERLLVALRQRIAAADNG